MTDAPEETVTLGKEIGSGAHGVVYRGRHHLHGPVAVKVLKQAPDQDDDEWHSHRESLLGEAHHLKAAEHGHVIRVFDVVQGPGCDEVLLVMELCDGACLDDDFMDGPMPINELRNVLNDVCLGLQAVHARGMLHRDIKPPNLLRFSNGRVKLSDFGHVTDEIVFGYASRAGYVDHMAREVFLRGQTSIATDLWALGMTVYRLLHGWEFYCRLPPPLDLVPRGGFARGLPFLPHIPDKWRRLVRALMHDDPARRPASAGAALSRVSALPIQPAWRCVWTENHVRWELDKATRIHVVEYEILSPRRHRWVAENRPKGKGRVMKLGSSSGVVGLRTAEDGLAAFFK